MNYFMDFYGFKKDPFETNHDVSMYYLSSVHKPVLSRLYKSVYEEGIDIIIGDEGTGKTITAKKLISELKRTKAIYIPYIDHSIEQIIKYIAQEILEKDIDGTKTEIISQIEDYTRDNRVIVVIDNIQQASLNTIENIRILSEIKNLKLILVGNLYFEKILRLSSMKQLSTRIRNFLFLKNLNRKDTRKYIDTKLYHAGGNISVSKASYKLIYEITKGNPYDINLLMEEALYLASLKKKKKIKPSIIKKAAKNLGFKVKRKIGILGTLIFLLILLIFGLFMYYTGIIGFDAKEQQQPEPKTQVEDSIQSEQEISKPEPLPQENKNVIKQEEKSEPDFIHATINVSLLNIRENPDTNSRILAVVPKGYKVKIIEEGQDGWVKVIYYSRSQGREITGWVKKKYLNIGEDNG